MREGRLGGRPPSWNQWRPRGELGLTSLLTVIPCPPFPSQWSDVRGGLVESQKCHHCPAVTRSLPTPWGQGGPHVGQYWGTSISPRKRRTTAGLVESWTPSLPQQKWGALSLIRCQQSWVGNMDFYPHLAVMRPHPHAPWQNKVGKSQLKNRRFNNTQSLKISTHTRFKQTNKNYSSYQNTGRFKLNGKR